MEKVKMTKEAKKIYVDEDKVIDYIKIGFLKEKTSEDKALLNFDEDKALLNDDKNIKKNKK